MREQERKRLDQRRADQDVLYAAARILRADAVQDHYAGYRDLDDPLYRASSLEESARQVDGLPSSVRKILLDEAAQLIERRRPERAARRGDRHPVEPLSAGPGH